MKFQSLALLPLISCINVACGQGSVTWSVLDKAIPKPISAGPDGLIYIAGGCDAKNGIVYNTVTTYFDCLSSTDDFLSFNPETLEFVLMELIPRPHYHHAAAVSNNVSFTASYSVWSITTATVDSVEIQAVALFQVARGDIRAVTNDKGGDKALVELDGVLFTVGGDDQVDPTCSPTIDPPDPGEATVALDEG